MTIAIGRAMRTRRQHRLHLTRFAALRAQVKPAVRRIKEAQRNFDRGRVTGR